MQIESAFDVGAPPETVFAFLLDVNRVAGCMPGAELSEVVDPTTFKGKVKIKVGPITVAYNGTARIVDIDEAAHTAKLEASGKETTGPGSANATTTMAVTESGSGGSTVKLTTEYTVAGRVANFGRGVMEDVSRRLVSQMADCIKQQIESGPSATASAAAEGEAAAVTGTTPAAPAAASTVPAPPQAKPVNALSLFFQVLWDRIRRLFGAKPQTS
jgi:uncharacterized protein